MKSFDIFTVIRPKDHREDFEGQPVAFLGDSLGMRDDTSAEGALRSWVENLLEMTPEEVIESLDLRAREVPLTTGGVAERKPTDVMTAKEWLKEND